MQGPKEVTDIAVAGRRIEIVDGIVDVSAEEAEFLKSHGFIRYVEPVGVYRPPSAFPSVAPGKKAK